MSRVGWCADVVSSCFSCTQAQETLSFHQAASTPERSPTGCLFYLKTVYPPPVLERDNDEKLWVPGRILSQQLPVFLHLAYVSTLNSSRTMGLLKMKISAKMKNQSSDLERADSRTHASKP